MSYVLGGSFVITQGGKTEQSLRISLIDNRHSEILAFDQSSHEQVFKLRLMFAVSKESKRVSAS